MPNIPHFYNLEYSEGDHIMNVEIDFRDPVPCLYMSEIKAWNPPYNNELINLTKKEEMIDNIYRYLTEIRGFKKIDIEK